MMGVDDKDGGDWATTVTYVQRDDGMLEVTEIKQTPIRLAQVKRTADGGSVGKCAIGYPGSDSGRCCCNCIHHFKDMSHPCTDGGRCTDQKGWICVPPEFGPRRAFSGWREHGMCEMHDFQPEGTTANNEQTDAHRAAVSPDWKRC